MIVLLRIFLLLILSPLALGEERFSENKKKVIAVRPAHRASSERLSNLSESEVVSQKTRHIKGRQVTFQKLPARGSGAGERERAGKLGRKVNPPVQMAPFAPVRYFQVFAKVYDHGMTDLTWVSLDSEEPAVYSGWSTINWNHLAGISSFESQGQQYGLLVFVQNISTEVLKRLEAEGREVERPKFPAVLRAMRQRGAKYTLNEGNPAVDLPMDFIESIHEFYDVEKRKILGERRERTRLARIKTREHRLNPPDKRPVEIRFRRVFKDQAKAARGDATTRKGGRK